MATSWDALALESPFRVIPNWVEMARCSSSFSLTSHYRWASPRRVITLSKVALQVIQSLNSKVFAALKMKSVGQQHSQQTEKEMLGGRCGWTSHCPPQGSTWFVILPVQLIYALFSLPYPNSVPPVWNYLQILRLSLKVYSLSPTPVPWSIQPHILHLAITSFQMPSMAFECGLRSLHMPTIGTSVILSSCLRLPFQL